ncbi:MAG: hypothetical protein IIY81_09505, partial [Lachnospiraceae bacterium]|nr:hypothetical protein [Lachnospiraceae bacterium]
CIYVPFGELSLSEVIFAVSILAQCGNVIFRICAVFNSILNTIRNRAAVGEKRTQKKTACHASFKLFFVHKKFTIFFFANNHIRISEQPYPH